MSKTLWLMCGAPGSGKSYFAKNILANDEHWFYISRDEIRFQIVKNDEEYFSHETEVYDCFIKKIQSIIWTIEQGNIIADATHLNKASRMKLLNRLDLNGVNVIPVYFNTPEHICQERNKQREGRTCVPANVIHKMYLSRSHPSSDGYKYTGILEVSGI